MANMAWVRQVVGGLLSFGRIAGSSISAEKKRVLLELVGIEDEEDDFGSEEQEDAEVWGEMALLCRPADPTADGNPEALFVRVGDEMVPLATRDLRWQVELEKGEVVLRSLGPSASRVILKPSGEVIVESSNVKLGSVTASQGIGLGDTLQQFVDVFWTWTPVANDGGLALKNALLAAWSSAPQVASWKHEVEP